MKKLINKKICIIHFGMPKTGSSSIQDYLFNSRLGSMLINLNNMPNQSLPIASLFSDRDDFNLVNKGLSRHQAINALQNFSICLEKSLSTKSQKLILSAESIFHFNEFELTRLKNKIESYDFEIKCIGYIRPVKSWLISSFQQRIKYTPMSLNDWLGRINLHRIYEKIFTIKKVFNSTNVEIVKFSADNLKNGNVVEDFCFRIGIEYDPLLNISVNESLSKEAVKILYVLNSHYRFNKSNFSRNKIKKRGDLLTFLSSMKHFSLKLDPFYLHSNLLLPIIPISKLNILEDKLGFSIIESDLTINDDIAIAHEREFFDLCADFSGKLFNRLGTNFKGNYQAGLSSSDFLKEATKFELFL